MTRIGLIVNPIAGIGGRAALKGSDDRALVERARAGGAVPVAPERTRVALGIVAAGHAELDLVTYPGAMGEDEARGVALEPLVLGRIGAETSAADTRAAATELVEAGAELLVVAGGDGTVVDVLESTGGRVPLVGVPAGVKMHSAVFAINPRSAGRLVLDVLQGRVRDVVEAEVMDVDEDALRDGFVSPRLYGYARVPAAPSLVQGAKARSAPGERASHEGIARELVGRMQDDGLWFLGPGTTTRSVTSALGLEKTVLGIDVVRSGALVAKDADEAALLALLDETHATVVVTPIGGQGFLFGRGNQQLSGEVLSRVGRERIVVAATEVKLAALGGRPLLVDTGDADCDTMLAGYVRVVTGYNREVVYRVGSDA